MFGVRLAMDFSERICTTLSLLCTPTYWLPNLASSKAVGSPARANAGQRQCQQRDEELLAFSFHGANLTRFRQTARHEIRPRALR